MEAFTHTHSFKNALLDVMDVRNCLWPTIRGKAACGGVAPSGPGRNIWTVRSETERSTERERERESFS